MTKPFVIHVDAERRFSGGEVQVFHLMRGLRADGFEQLLVAQPASDIAEQARVEGFDVAEIAMRNSGDVSAVCRLRRVFQAHDSSDGLVIQLHTGRATWLGAWAAAGLGAFVVSTRRMDRRVKRGLGTRLLYTRLVDRVVAISGPVRDCLVQGGVASHRIQLIHDSVLLAELVHENPAAARKEQRAELGIDEDEFVGLVLSRLHARKGIDVLLKAIERLANRAGLEALRRRNTRASKSARKRSQTTIHDERIDPEESIRIVIAGDGPERDALEAQARDLTTPDAVTFLGSRSDKAALLAMCDVLVLPSHQEGLGVAALEAMGASRAIIASRVGGLAETVIEDRTGLLVEPGDVDGLADALERLAADRSMCRKLGAGGPGRLSEGFLTHQMVAAYVELYCESSSSA